MSSAHDEKQQSDGATVLSGDVTLTEHHALYQYLTYETILPELETHSSQSPAAPNLRRYDSPFEWPERRKSFTLWLTCLATCVSGTTAGSFSAAVPGMSNEWHVSEVAMLVGITMFCCGFGIAPMVLAPFSEINGRYPVLVCAGIVYVCILSPLYGQGY